MGIFPSLFSSQCFPQTVREHHILHPRHVCYYTMTNKHHSTFFIWYFRKSLFCVPPDCRKDGVYLSLNEFRKIMKFLDALIMLLQLNMWPYSQKYTLAAHSFNIIFSLHNVGFILWKKQKVNVTCTLNLSPHQPF